MTTNAILSTERWTCYSTSPANLKTSLPRHCKVSDAHKNRRTTLKRTGATDYKFSWVTQSASIRKPMKTDPPTDAPGGLRDAACSPSDLISFVRRYNAWRRGDDSIPQPDPSEIGKALDEVCSLAELALVEKSRLDALETQSCWIGLKDGWSVQPKWDAGGEFIHTVREVADIILENA